MFIPIKVFVKSKFPNVYNSVRALSVPLYIKIYRQNILKSFTKVTYKKVSFMGEKYGIWLDPQNAFIDEEIYVNGVYEPEILALHKKYLRPGDVYIDIGANIGDTSLFAASIVGEKGKVICFEPIAHLAKQIKKSADSNGFTQVSIIQKAISINIGETTIYKNKNNIGASSMIDLQINGEEEKILTTDAHELETLSKINVIKIDVEGYEWIVVKALKKRIERYRPIVFFEYTPNLYGEDKYKIIEYFVDIGYTLFDIEDNLSEINNSAQWCNSFNKEQTNILCIYE